MSERTEITRIDPKKTWIPLGTVLGFCVMLGTIHTWLNRELSGIQSELLLIRQNMENVAKENWSRNDMYNWTYMFKENNRELFVPNPVANQGSSGRGGGGG